MKKKYFFKRMLLLLTIFATPYSYSQIKNSFDVRYQTTVRGDMTMISNNIVSRAPANTPYNTVGNTSEYNDDVNMQYIDIDTDNTTYNSSSANLNVPDPLCSRVVHAGLYWSATYRYQTGNNPASGRFEDWNTVKFKVPGGNYVNISPTSAPYNSEVLYNGFADPNQTNVTHGPYSCFADVTSLVANLTNPNGNYFVGNIRVSRDGRRNTGDFAIPGGIAGGWTLVIVYENISLPGKKITTFDGHAVIASGVGNLDIPVSGFVTLPAPLPVRAKMGVVALEGDNRIGGDQLLIKANGVPTYTTLFNTPPPAAPITTNFFDSSITVNGTSFTTRNPNSLNTLGWDSHLIRINNAANSVIPNDETGVTLRATSDRDKYDIFFTSFDVEIIEPKIPLIKTVEDFSGNNIDGQSLGLGQEFFYSLCFQNTGNDDAQNFVINDQLPTNIIFPVNGTITSGVDLILPPGVTYTYNAATNQLTFTIPNNLVEENDPQYCIKIKVRTPVDCNDVIDACANIVTNQAYIRYQGIQNTQVISDNPSYNGLDICTRPTPGATNFLTNIDLCSFVREEVLCGNSVVLIAANGYSSYSWTYDHDNNPATAPIPFPGGNTQSITVSNVGAYYVNMITPAPCISLNETINVVYFNNLASISNPIIPFADEVAICPNNGEELPKIILCGVDDSQFIQTGITSATSIVWQKLVVGSCPGVAITNCANTNNSCVWNQVGSGPNYLADTAGQYRMIIYYQNGCFRTFYFNVYKNLLNPTITSTDIVCNTLGTITISGIPAGYEFSLNSSTGPWQTNNVFGGLTNGGSYNVYIRQTGVTNGCVFPFLSIPVIKKNLSVNVITTNQTCNNGFGSVRVQVNGVNPQYYYQLTQGAAIINSVGPTSANNYLFSNLNPGNYTVTATTDDGCTYTENVTITAIVPLAVTATAFSASCLFINDEDGNPTIPILGTITLAGSGGTPIYNYGIYSINGTVQNPIVYQTNPVFNIPVGGQGTYVFNIVDDNNCISRSNSVTIVVEPPLVFTTNITNVSCNGLNNGSVILVTSSTLGYTLTYSIDGTNFQASNTFSSLAPGSYTFTIKATKGTVVCTYTVTATITQPQPLTGQSNLDQQKTCLVNGIISAINVSGGTAPYMYSINGTTFQTSNVFLNLNTGTYTITIRDARQCSFTTLPIEITPAVPPTQLNITNTSLTCPTLVSTITATVVGGTAPFTFQIIAPSVIAATTTVGSTATFAGLTAGTYTIKVTDSKGCNIQNNRTIVPIVNITLGGNVVSNVQCINTATGSLLLNVGGFSTNYSYTVNNGTAVTGQTSTTISFTNLAANTYTIVVTDAVTNCTASLSLTITQPSAALQLQAPFSPIRCSSNGSLNATATGGWGSYQYTLTLPNATTLVQTSGVFNNLSQTGVYTISVRDANNCIVSSTFTLSTPASPTISILPTSNLCITSTAGATLNVTTTGGTPPYQYQLNTGALQSASSFPNLQAGTYIIKVVDSFGCENTITQVIRPQLTAQAVLNKDLDCSATPNASITVNITGGLSPYRYQIRFNNGTFGALTTITTGSTFNLSTANAGTYQFLITDAQNCTFLTNIITVNPIVNPSITSITQVTPSCFGFNNGSLTVNINSSLGTSPFMYSLNNGTFQTSNFFPNLVAGTYTIVVKDAKECTATQTVVLGQPEVLTGTSNLVQQISCINLTGTISAINVSGGTIPYQYTINGTFSTNPVFANLGAGTYTITIKDANGCTIVTSPITLTTPLPPADITLTSSAITCPSLTTTVQAAVLGGTAPYTYQIIAPNIINPTNTTGNSASFANLPASSTTVYTIKVTDANGCPYQKNITIQALPTISVSGTVNNNIGCFGATDGRATFTVTGATNFSYSLNSGTVVTNQTNPVLVFPNLAAGNYTLLITDSVTNCTATTTITISSPIAVLALTPNVTQPTCDVLGSINAIATGGWGSNQYTLTFPNGTQVTQNNGAFTGLAADTNPYTISVRDVNGCVVSQNFTLVPYISPTLSINVASDLCYDTVNAASIIVNVTGGTANYQYQIKLGASAYGALQSSNQFLNLTPGTYTIKVIDSKNCFAEIVQVIAPQIIPIASLTKGLDCTASPNATISLNVTGGVAPYQYQVKFNSNPWSTIAALPTNPFVYSTANAGNYQFQITDAAGCVMVSNTITITPISNPQIASLTQLGTILCNGNTSAGIQVNPNPMLGQSPFMYSLNSGIFQSSPLFTGLGAGVYTITIQDVNFCTSSLSITISQPAALSFIATKTDLFCSGTPGGGTTLGSITVTNVVGGTQPLTYNIRNLTFDLIDTFNPVTNENHTFNNVDFGNYIIEVIDANGCPITSNITIASPPNSLIAVNATANCSTGATVEVTVLAIVPGNDYEFGILNSANAPYVIAPYVYQPADVLGGFTSTFTNLVPGLSYTFVVHDRTSDCYFIQDVPTQILPSSTITFDALISQNVTCTGSSNGNVTFTINNFDGATTSVTYTVYETITNNITPFTGTVPVTGPSNPITISNLGSLDFGSYYIVVVENGGCTAVSPEFTILESTIQLQVTAQVIKNPNCNPNSGTILANAQFGTPPYQYLVQSDTALPPTSGAAFGGSFSNTLDQDINGNQIIAGNYLVYAQDANFCVVATPLTIIVTADANPVINLSLDTPCAMQGQYEITVTRDPGTITPYTYTINNGVAFTEVSNPFTIQNLSSGSYNIEVTDGNGCKNDETIIITPKALITTEIISQPSCTAGGSVTISASGGVGPFTYSIQNNAGTTILTNATGVFSDSLLVPGNYTATISDQNLNGTNTNCITSNTFSLETPTPVLFTVNTQNPSCNLASDGQITVLLNPLNINNPPYTYTLTATGFTTVTQIGNNVFTGLGQNNYAVTVTSNRNCDLTLPAILTDPDPLVANDPNTYSFTCTNSGVIVLNGLTVTGGDSNYFYSIDNVSFQTTNEFTITDIGSQQTITIYVKDGKGCTTQFTYTPFEPLVTINNPSIAVNPQLSCAGGEQITVTFNAGPNSSGNYTYQLLPIMPGVVATPFTDASLTPSFIPPLLTATGDYTYQVIDTTTGCSLLVTHSVLAYPVTSVTAQETQAIDCFGNANGQFSFSLVNYTGSYSYEIFSSPSDTSIITGTSSLTTINSPNTLLAGNYYVVVTENAYPSCIITSPIVTITSPFEALDVQLVASNDRNCLTNTGTILATATGGTPPYLYQLSDSGGIVQAFSSNNYFENLPNDSYTVAVTDNKSCSTSKTILVDVDPTPTIDIAIVNPCVAEGLFEINVTRTVDGIAPYTYIIDANAPITQNTTPFVVSNLLSGLHTITITDANGCGETKTLTILPVLNGTITSITQPSCATFDGIIDANATNGSGSYSYILQNSTNVTIAGPNTDGLFNFLGFGNYTVIITDADPTVNCSIQLPVSLEEPTPVNYTLEVIQPTCNVLNGGVSNGSINVVLDASNDNGPYTFELNDGTNPPTIQNNPLFTGLEGSDTGITYTITVTSNRGCKKIETQVLQTPTPIVIPTITVGQFGCNTTTNSPEIVTITVPTPTGGTAPYLYSFDGTNFGQTNTLDIVDNGMMQTITVTVRDANSCDATQTVSINPLDKVQATIIQVSALTCSNNEVVEITIVGDATHNYTYQLLPSGTVTAVTSNPFTTTLSQPGTYNYLIVDTTTNCSDITDDYVINPLSIFEVDATTVDNVSCYGGNGGSLEFNVTGYSGTFTYDVIDEAGATYFSGTSNTSSNPTLVSGLIAGNYTVSVSIPNSNQYDSCIKTSNSITINQPQEILFTISQSAPVTCTNDQGVISIGAVSGGTGTYEYQLLSLPSGTILYPFNASYATTGFTGIGFGDYQVIVRDSNSCSASQNINLLQVFPVTATYTITNQNLSCFNDSNASVTLANTANGSGEYQYALTYPNGNIAGPQQSPTFTGLQAGNGYFITILDGWNCDVQLASFNINQPQPLLASLSLETTITCQTNPQVRITASGGTAPYFVNGQTFNSSIVLDAIMPAIGSGIFEFIVTDSNNCSPVTTNPITINPIPDIEVTLLALEITVNCFEDDNALIIVTNTTGGQGNYIYQLQDSAGANIGPSNSSGIFQGIAGSLIPGETYYVHVISGDCEANSPAILVTEPLALIAPIISVTNVTCAGQLDGSIRVTLDGGIMPYQFAVSPNLSQTIDPDTNANTMNLTGLGAGTYTVLYQDANGCFATITRTITEPTALVFFQPTIVQPICDGESGSVTVTASGGSPGPNGYEFSFNGNTNYATNGTNTYTNTTDIFGDSVYEVWIKDNNGCETNIAFQTQPTVDLSSTYVVNPNCDTQTYNLEFFINNSLLPTTQFSLNGPNNYQAFGVTEFNNLAPGTYTAYIKNTNGCIVQTETIVLDPFVILSLTAQEIPNALNQISATALGGTEPYTFIFNGNNTGTNNVYLIDFTGQQTITVIDDNGCERTVLLPATFYDIEIPNYFTPDNGWTPLNIDNFNNLITKVFDRYGREVALLRKGQRWDGNYKGNPLPSGDYWYLIEVNDGTDRTFVGNVTLYR